MASTIYDTIIIGAGPAGAAAAIYASRAGISTLWIDNRFIPGGQIADSAFIDNYPGFPGIAGAELGEAMAAHAAGLGMEPIRAKVLRIMREESGLWLLHTKKNDYTAKTVIYACGAAHRHLEIPGEEELAGSGVSYCATCDGAFFKDQDTAVIGGGNTACEDALFLAKLCRKVYLVHRRDELRADKVLQELVAKTENIRILWSTVPTEILGDTEVTGLSVKPAGMSLTAHVPEATDPLNAPVPAAGASVSPARKPETASPSEASILPVNGVFIAAGMVPNSALLEGLVDMDETGYVKAGEDCRTSAPGFFAAGDVRTKPLRQIVTAVSDGANAATSALLYLQNQI